MSESHSVHFDEGEQLRRISEQLLHRLLHRHRLPCPWKTAYIHRALAAAAPDGAPDVLSHDAELTLASVEHVGTRIQLQRAARRVAHGLE